MKNSVLSLLIIGLIGCNVAHAGNRTATLKTDTHISVTTTDDACTDPAFSKMPQTAPLKNASAYDAKANETITGCSLDYGDFIEFQLHDAANVRHWQFKLPTEAFKEVLPI